MKITFLFAAAALCAATFFPACKNEGDAARDAAVNSVGVQPAGDPAANPAAPNATPAATEPPQNAAGVWHYTCPKGCAGGGGSATACPICGATLAHNTAYHANANPAATTTLTTPGTTPVPSPSAPTLVPNPAVPNPAAPTPEPAQNKAGVWHYTCPSGCAGGGGSAIACSKCGKTLAHNTAYHQ